MTYKVPKHIAIIMDGNGRWATKQGLPRTAGHEEGANRVREITRACRKMGVKVLTLYSFSTENWKRPKEEVSLLWDLLKRYIKIERQELLDNGIRLNAIGQIDRLPMIVRLPLKALMKETADNNEMILNLALSYGSRQEIVDAVQRIGEKIKKGELDPSNLSESLFSQYLYTAGMPDPEVIIRTSGEVRLSNFLMWQAAYAELVVVDLPWPEFTEEKLIEALKSFSARERRFGKTGQQCQKKK
jgi:undecaprenyl diphosphate synthase